MLKLSKLSRFPAYPKNASFCRKNVFFNKTNFAKFKFMIYLPKTMFKYMIYQPPPPKPAKIGCSKKQSSSLWATSIPLFKFMIYLIVSNFRFVCLVFVPLLSFCFVFFFFFFFFLFFLFIFFFFFFFFFLPSCCLYFFIFFSSFFCFFDLEAKEGTERKEGRKIKKQIMQESKEGRETKRKKEKETTEGNKRYKDIKNIEERGSYDHFRWIEWKMSMQRGIENQGSLRPPLDQQLLHMTHCLTISVRCFLHH